MTQKRIYLDNAATSWPKPEAVYEAVDHYQREIGAPNGRSGYSPGQESNRIVDRARRGVADLIGATDPLAHRLRLQLHRRAQHGDPRHRPPGRPRRHDRLRSQLRPAARCAMLAEDADVEVTYVPCDGQGYVSPRRCPSRDPPRHAARRRQPRLERHRRHPTDRRNRPHRTRDRRVLPRRRRPIAGPRAARRTHARCRSAGRPGPQGLARPARHRRPLHARRASNAN